MVIAEGTVKVPGKKYKVKIQCMATRRLTAMEWLIVHSAASFKDDPNIMVKYFFEEVLQMTSSEILIKPCLTNLIEDKVITIEPDNKFDYIKLHFSDIKLSPKGIRMVEDGLFPGEITEIPVDIYYNPLSNAMTQYHEYYDDTQHSVELGMQEDYDVDFPEKEIIKSLHNGNVGGNKFIASKMRIESIDCLSSSDIDMYTKLEIEAVNNEFIKTDPVIRLNQIKKKIIDVFKTPELDDKMINNFIDYERIDVHNIIGSGERIKESILNVCKNGKIIVIDESIFDKIKKYSSTLKNKTVIVFNSDSLDFEVNKNYVLVHVKDNFNIPGCALINEKNNSISLCRKEYHYDDDTIKVPLAVEDRIIYSGENGVRDWLSKIIKNNYNECIEYLALCSIEELGLSIDSSELLLEIMEKQNVDEFVDCLKKVKHCCEKLETKMLNIRNYEDVFWNKLSEYNSNDLIDKYNELISLKCFNINTEAHKNIVKKLIAKIEIPDNIEEVNDTIRALGIKTHDDAVFYDDLMLRFFSKKFYENIIESIVTDKYVISQELFAHDVFFNEYYKSIKALEYLLSGIKLFKLLDDDALNNSLSKCSDLAYVQLNIASIIEKNEAKINGEFTVVEIMNGVDFSATANLQHNLNRLRILLPVEIKARTSSISANEVFVIDTCALIHQPDLMLYFKDDDWVRIPTTVIDELSKIKDQRSSKYSSELSSAARNISNQLDKKYLKLFNTESPIRLMIENSYPDLLPPDLPIDVHDNQILSVALKYSDSNVTVISDDAAFKLICSAQNIKTVSSDEFLNEHKKFKKTLSLWEKDYMKSGKKLIDGLPDSSAEIKETQLKKETVDDNSINRLGEFYKKLDDPKIIEYLKENGINTMDAFEKLSADELAGFPAKSKQQIIKNAIMRIKDTDL